MSGISSTTSGPRVDLLTNPAFKAQKTRSEAGDFLSAVNESVEKGFARQVQDDVKIDDDARKAAEGLVSTTFIEPILKQVRESNDAPPPFGPGKGEKQFGAILDTKLADQIVHAANFPLVERIAAQLMRNMPGGEPTQQVDVKG